MSARWPRILPFGDAALLVEWPEAIDPATNRLVHALAASVAQEWQAGTAWRAPVPAYSSLLAAYDPLRLDRLSAERRLSELVELLKGWIIEADDEQPLLEVPVRYGGQDGPDLGDVAAHTGLTAERVVELHSRPTYRAYFLGFAPGFAYLGSVANELQLPRRATPRQRVPPGSVGIAGAQTAVYPLATPGGWHLLGRTDLVLWDAQRDPPALIRPGQAVRFVPQSD